nr:TonB-dependent receptor [Prevotella sp.]
MRSKVKIAVIAFCYAPLAMAQNVQTTEQQQAKQLDENAFTFTEAQLDEDQNSSQGITILNSNTNVYASQVGFLFSPMRFRYRAFGQKYNEIYINGAPVNDAERGQFSFSSIGGLNQLTRNVDFSLPFENNNFAMSGMAGSNNYDFRAGSQRVGNRFSLGGANRNYTLRGMYSYGSGFNKKGWAFTGHVTYRWANEGYVEGTFYNSFSYFLGVEKILNEKNRLSFSTWGNPTERASQGAATEESYWLANDYYYNPYWGYQNGKKRNSRIVHDYAPTALFTWDWTINDKQKLTTTLLGKYSIYKSTKLNYNNSDNPAPDYWKVLPSSYYDVWGKGTGLTGYTDYQNYQNAVDYLMYSKANRQINWDRLYAANRSMNSVGSDAMYYVQARHNNNLYLTLASTLTTKQSENTSWNAGVVLSTNKGMHYQTMDDLLGASVFHNINTYAIGTYSATSDEVQYDLNNPNAEVHSGDKFGYNYNIFTNKGFAWGNYAANVGPLRFTLSGKVGGTTLERDGKMKNGLFKENSYGKSGTAKFLDGGAKGSVLFDAGHGHVLSVGAGYQWNAPLADVAFQAAEMNNDFVSNLKNERVFSSEIAYQYSNSFMHANLSGYFSQVDNATEWTCFFFDDINSFSYNSITGLQKRYYGAELGLDFKITSWMNVNAIGQWSEAKNSSDADVIYLNSTQGEYTTDRALIKNMRESGTPLTAASLGIDIHSNGWFLSLNCNYYDRIYLSYSPYWRYKSKVESNTYSEGDGYGVYTDADGNTHYVVSDQQKGHGGFMLDGSIGKNINLKKGALSINLSLTNILNNRKIITGGYEQSRSDNTSSGNYRGYVFSLNPKTYHVYGTNGMLQISYRF